MPINRILSVGLHLRDLLFAVYNSSALSRLLSNANIQRIESGAFVILHCLGGRNNFNWQAAVSKTQQDFNWAIKCNLSQMPALLSSMRLCVCVRAWEKKTRPICWLIYLQLRGRNCDEEPAGPICVRVRERATQPMHNSRNKIKNTQNAEARGIRTQINHEILCRKVAADREFVYSTRGRRRRKKEK